MARAHPRRPARPLRCSRAAAKLECCRVRPLGPGVVFCVCAEAGSAAAVHLPAIVLERPRRRRHQQLAWTAQVPLTRTRRESTLRTRRPQIQARPPQRASPVRARHAANAMDTRAVARWHCSRRAPLLSTRLRTLLPSAGAAVHAGARVQLRARPARTKTRRRMSNRRRRRTLTVRCALTPRVCT